MNRYMQKGLEHKKAKFYQHLKVYLIFVGFMVSVNVFAGAGADFYPIAFWWGFGVVAHYLRTFGWAGMAEQSTLEQESAARPYEAPAELEEEEFVELKQPQKAWRDRDLV